MIRVIISIALLLALLIIGCASSPKLYGITSKINQSHTKDDSTDQENSNQENDSLSNTNPATAEQIKNTTNDSSQPSEQTISGAQNRLHKHTNSSSSDAWNYSSNIDVNNSVSAVDDEVWRQLDLAQEYHAMGVMANREGSWEEAQYYFEKGMKVLATIEIESDSLETPESVQYTIIHENIITDFKITLKSLEHSEDDISSSIIIERFRDIENTMTYNSTTNPENVEHLPHNQNSKSTIEFKNTKATQKDEESLEFSFTIEEFINRYNQSLSKLETGIRIWLEDEENSDVSGEILISSNRNIFLKLAVNNKTHKVRETVFYCKAEEDVESNLNSLLAIVAIAMAIENPNMSLSQREKFLNILIDSIGLSTEKEIFEIERNNIKYSIAISSDISGIMLIAKPTKNNNHYLEKSKHPQVTPLDEMFTIVESRDISHGAANRITFWIKLTKDCSQDEIRQIISSVTSNQKSFYDIIWLEIVPKTGKPRPEGFYGWRPLLCMTKWVSPALDTQWHTPFDGFGTHDEWYEGIAIKWYGN